jgi:endonuclease YncB( thermonuclease family)
MTETWSWPRATVVDHYDGDTFYADVDQGRGTHWQRASIRLAGIDAPELRRKGQVGPDPGAVAARDFLISLLPLGAKVELSSVGYDKYGDRVDAIVVRKSDGLNVNEAMVAVGYAVAKDYA